MPINAGPSMGMSILPGRRKPNMLNSSGGNTPGNLPRGMVDSSGPGQGNAPPGGPMGYDRLGRTGPNGRPLTMMNSMGGGGFGGVVDPSFRDKIAQGASSFRKEADPNAVMMQNAGYGRGVGIPDIQGMQNQRMQQMQQMMNPMMQMFNPMMMYGMGGMGMNPYSMGGQGGMMGGYGGGLNAGPSPQMMMRQFNLPPWMMGGGMNTGIAGGGFRGY